MTLAITSDHRGVTTLTLNRADKANAINHELLMSLFNALRDAAESSNVRVIVLRGAGKNFCAGADISDLAHERAGPTIPELCNALDQIPKPTLCVVQGACMGAGLALAACCDTVIAARDARFSIPEVRLGIAPLPLMPLMIRACGERFLRRYVLSGAQFNSHEAHRAGLVHDVCEPQALEDTLDTSIDNYLRAAPGAAMTAKQFLRRLSLSSQAHTQRELNQVFENLAAAEEAREGLASLKEKRRPRWHPS
jgi:methylglutaconyl-CoA hydratase